jgi:hypothetical protein
MIWFELHETIKNIFYPGLLASAQPEAFNGDVHFIFIQAAPIFCAWFVNVIV